MKTFIQSRLQSSIVELDAEAAYDKWAARYDFQPLNLILDLDTTIFQSLTEKINFANAEVIDFGCGTGRHWPYILNKKPASLCGYDGSVEMLQRLKSKFPNANVIHQKDPTIRRRSNAADILISTLTIAHIKNIEPYIKEWSRVLKPGGCMIITDYHPDAIQTNARRTFTSEGKQFSIKCWIHSIQEISSLAATYGLINVELIERCIDETMKPWYLKQNALSIFEQFEGLPIIYGVRLQKEA